MQDMNLKVREIFYSLQGEGSRQGEASVFIRLANCNLNCWFCDTDWSYGEEMQVDHIIEMINEIYPNALWIIWTGGEPTLQLTKDIINRFKSEGFLQAIETNGTNKIPPGLDYITVSPKIDPKQLRLNVNRVDELRYPIGVGEEPPDIVELPKADHYYVSPIFTGEKKSRMELNDNNVQHCINYVKKNPVWKLSLQIHKLLKIQ